MYVTVIKLNILSIHVILTLKKNCKSNFTFIMLPNNCIVIKMLSNNRNTIQTQCLDTDYNVKRLFLVFTFQN